MYFIICYYSCLLNHKLLILYVFFLIMSQNSDNVYIMTY